MYIFNKAHLGKKHIAEVRANWPCSYRHRYLFGVWVLGLSGISSVPAVGSVRSVVHGFLSLFEVSYVKG